MTLTLGSLFDGIGGWPDAAIRAGVKPLWASEIEPFPAAVTAHHYPGMKQLGDITKINVDELEPVDIICAGSPCQDLSTAGKRKGLAGERSGLFRTAIDIVHRLRERTGKPRFFVWENVPGAFSSNGGADFRAVLEEIGQAEIPMPERNKWATSGMVQCDQCEIAWRVLDAQYWGVPQRRKRIFLVADFAAADRRAAEVLFVEPCLSRDTAEGEGTGQEATGNVGESVDSASYGIDHVITTGGNCTAQGKCYYEERCPTMKAGGVHGVFDGRHIDNAGGTLTPWDVQSNRIQAINGTAAALYGGAGQGTHNGAVFDTRHVAYSFDSLASNSMKSANPHSGCRQVEIAKCLDTTVPNPSKNQGGIAIVCKPKEVEYAITAKHYKNRNAALRDRERINVMREKTVGALLRRDYKGIGNQDLPKCDKLIIEKEQQ